MKMIGDAGAKALSVVLEQTTTIYTINLSYNNSTDNRAQFIIHALKINHKLTSFNVGGNNINTDNMQEIANILAMINDQCQELKQETISEDSIILLKLIMMGTHLDPQMMIMIGRICQVTTIVVQLRQQLAITAQPLSRQRNLLIVIILTMLAQQEIIVKMKCNQPVNLHLMLVSNKI